LLVDVAFYLTFALVLLAFWSACAFFAGGWFSMSAQGRATELLHLGGHLLAGLISPTAAAADRASGETGG